MDATSSPIERRADRNAAAKRFAHRDQVRLEAQRAEVERLSGASEAALDFVGNEQRARSSRTPGDGVCEAPASAAWTPPSPCIGSAMMAAVDDETRREQRRGIVHGHETHARQQRLERRAVVLVAT